MSFIEEEEEEQDLDLQSTQPRKRRYFGKNPDVNTHFLTVRTIYILTLTTKDKERIEEDLKLKRKLIEEFIEN